MREDNIKETVRIARHFIERAQRLINSPQKNYEISGSRLSGDLRRISMELTRALADMRKPQ